MKISQAMRTVGVALGALLLGVCAHVTAYGQSDRSDRPDSQEVRTSRREEARHKQQAQAPPEEDARKQTDKYSRTPKAGALKGIRTLGVVGLDASGSSNPFQDTFDRATADYKSFLEKFSNTAYANSHVKLRFEDFAPAYFIVLDEQVRGKVGTGMELAEKRAQLRTYEKILRQDAGLDEETAERIEREAKQALKSFRK